MKQKRQKDLPPVFRTPEFAEAHEQGNVERFLELLQPEMRYICTRIEGWRHCRLPRCRRARACTGNNKQEAFHPNFPPCISDNDWHQRWLKEHRLYEDELAEAYGFFANDQ